jgi:hypothetical protein
MDLTGITGTAWHDGELVGDFELRGGRELRMREVQVGTQIEVVPDREIEHVQIRFMDFVATGIQEALNAIANRRRLTKPLVLDLELEDGTKLPGCHVAGYWGGKLGERWYGIDLDFDRLQNPAT